MVNQYETPNIISANHSLLNIPTKRFFYMSQINETQNHLLEQGVFNCAQAEAQAYWPVEF